MAVTIDQVTLDSLGNGEMTTFVNLVLIVIDYAEARDADCGGQISF